MCKYCEGKEDLILISEVSSLFINGNKLKMFGGSWCGNLSEGEKEIKFCPICGQKV